MLIELMRRGAAAAPDRPVIIAGERTVSYSDSLARSEAFGRGLRSAGISRFGAALIDPASVLVALAGASAVGAEPCVYPRELDSKRAAKLAGAFGHRNVISDRDEALGVPGEMRFDAVDAEADEPLERPGAAPILILTTGTTGEQKGARHDWARLVRAVRRPDERGDTRWLLAYNLNQFAGLQVLLHVLASGSTLVVPARNRPLEGIAALQAARVTHASATPTFWRLLVGSIDTAAARELPLRQITLGGEAAPESLIARLHELFPTASISHVYAGTEFGSAVSVHDGHSGLPASVLARRDDGDAQLRIVDGELQVRSPAGMLGYHQRPDGPADEWRATGDLVELRGDRIHFVGRTTEVINVGGAKVHPLPIEEIACAVEGVQLAAAYGRPNAITGELVALDVVSVPGADLAALESMIRDACEALPRAGRPRRIRFVPELQLRGNKLVRSEP